MDLDRLLALPGFQAAVVSFCLLCSVLLLCYCLFKYTAVSRTRGFSTSKKRKNAYSGVKVLPRLPDSKRPVPKKNFSVTKQLSVSNRNVKRIKHEYESNGIRFNKKQNFLKSQATNKAQEKRTRVREKRKSMSKSKLLPVSNQAGAQDKEKQTVGPSAKEHSNFAHHSIKRDFSYEQNKLNHEVSMIKDKQLENLAIKLENRRAQVKG